MNVEFKNLSALDKRPKSGLGFPAYLHIYVQARNEYDIRLLRNFITEHFKVYDAAQRNVDNPKDGFVPYGEHELYLWPSGYYYQLTVNHKDVPEERIHEIKEVFHEALLTTFNELNVDVRFAEGFVFQANKVEDFLRDYTLDLDNLQLEKLHLIQPNYLSFPALSAEATEKLSQLNASFKSLIAGKTVMINNLMKGKFRLIGEDYVFFKLRARNSYYRYHLNDIHTIQFF